MISCTRLHIRRVCLAALALLFLSPTIFVATRSISRFSLDWFEHLSKSVLPAYLANTAIAALSSSLVALALAWIPAYVVHAFRFPGRRLAVLLALMPMCVPAYVLAAICFELAGATALQSPWAMGAVIGASTSPWIFIFLLLGLGRVPSSLAESARVLGQGKWKRAFRVHLPLLSGPLLGSVLFVATETVGDLGTARRLGVATFTVGLHEQWLALRRDDVGSSLSLVLLATSVLPAVVAVLLLFRDSVLKAAVPSRPHPGTRADKRSLVWIYGACLLASLPGFLFPVAVSLGWTVRKMSRIQLSTLYSDCLNTVGTASLIVLVCLTLTALFAFLSERGQKMRFLDRAPWFTLLNLALSPLVFAVVLLELGSATPAFSLFLTPIENTRALLVLVDTARLLPFVLIPASIALGNLSTQVIDSARTLGAPSSQVFRRIVVPHIQMPLMAGGLLIFIEASKQLTAGLLLQPFGYSSISMRIFSYTGMQMIHEAAVWLVVQILVLVYPVWVISSFLERRGSHA